MLSRFPNAGSEPRASIDEYQQENNNQQENVDSTHHCSMGEKDGSVWNRRSNLCGVMKIYQEQIAPVHHAATKETTSYKQ